ncbi:MAG TPA: VLRF1 family aeRF1-type release factor [Nitriliruptorales bacterium]|nr:VLRF1 family aeRF1-type release factor [Nitriliruptorales bacterium]
MSIDQGTILDLIGMRDDIGVLSVYVGITPDRAAEPKPGWPIAIRNQLRDLRQRVRDEGTHEDAEALAERIDALDGQLTRLLDASRYGRGRALFATVGDERVETIAIQMPFRDRVVFDRSPFVRPLVAALDEGRAAGIAVVHKRGVRLLEWRLGGAAEITREEFTVGGRDWREKSGPAPAQPLDTRQGGHKRDQFEDRVHENLLRFVRDSARDVADEANTRRWDRLIVSGDPRLTKPFAEELHPAGGEQLEVMDLSWEDEAPNTIAEQAWDTFRALRHDRMARLVTEAKDRALSGGAGALGLPDTLGALNQGRIDYLLFDAELSVDGYRNVDGLLFTHPQQPGADGAQHEPFLVERMVERALATSATAVPCEGQAAELLREFDGVAAILRW